MGKKKIIFFIVGPTAVGKTEFGIELARRMETEIISADSMQIYRYMDIGTGKPTEAERALVPHHLIDFVHPSEPYSAGRYRKDADAVIGRLHAEGKVPIVVGGTGLYVRALTDGLFEGPEADHDLRNHFKERVSKEGLNTLYLHLKSVDPISANRIHPNDESRIIRALEVYELTGRPISELQTEHKARAGETFRYVLYGLTTSRNRLYTRIEERVDRMLERGLDDEVRGLLKMGVPEDSVSMQGLGYKEMIPYIQGSLPLLSCVETLKRESRHFAKRQITWFRADPRIDWLDIGSFWSRDKALESFLQYAEGEIHGRKISGTASSPIF